MSNSTVFRPTRLNLSEDWLATIIGLAIVVIIALGVIGPGPQSVTISVPAGDTRTATLLPLERWSVSMALKGESGAVSNAPSILGAGQTYVLTCSDNTLQSTSTGVPAGISQAPSDRAQLVVVNACDADMTVKYTTSSAIPWPVFKVF